MYERALKKCLTSHSLMTLNKHQSGRVEGKDLTPYCQLSAGGSKPAEWAALTRTTRTKKSVPNVLQFVLADVTESPFWIPKFARVCVRACVRGSIGNRHAGWGERGCIKANPQQKPNHTSSSSSGNQSLR
jgi:hypothetical protein